MFDEPVERAAIAELGQALTQAWNRGDATAYAALFTEDADYVAFNGSYARGRQAIEETHRWLFEGPLAGSHLSSTSSGRTAEPSSLRFLRSDVGVLVNSGSTALAGQPAPAPDRDSVHTAVVVKNPEGWRFASFHNTRK